MGKRKKKLVDQYGGDIRLLIRNKRFHIIKKLSDKVKMDAYIKYKDNQAILKFIADSIKIKDMGYMEPHEMV